MFDRVISLIGEDNFNKIQKRKVVVIGVGGVGSNLALALVRSGVKDITLVDYDIIDISNLNRQIMTNKNNIGKLKVEELKKLLLSINDDINIKTYPTYLDSNNIIDILCDRDFIFDCCDDIKVKKEIIKYCLDNKKDFIIATGTAKKMDPSKLEIVDIRKTSYDPICKIIRKWVVDNKIKGNIWCCYSKEKIINRGKVLSSMIFVPATCGLMMASFFVNKVIMDEKSSK